MNLKDWAVRFAQEPTPGGVVSGAYQALIATDFKPGATGPDRTPTGGVSPNQQVYYNTASYSDSDITMTVPSLYDHLRLFRAAVCGQTDYSAPVTVTGTDITAAATGNKLSKVGADWGTDLKAGQVVQVDGFAGGSGKNPVSFAAKLASDPLGTDLVLEWPTLHTETPAGAVTVKHLGQLRFGTSFPTFSFEAWNAIRSIGDVYNRVAVKDWTWTSDMKTKEGAVEAFTFLQGANPLPITAQLSNGTTATPPRNVHNTNVDFGSQLTPTYGGGCRYNGVEYPAGSDSGKVRIQKVEMKISRPVSTSGGLGAYGPLSVFTDGLVPVMLTIDVYRDSALAETMRADRDNLSFVGNVGFADADPAMKRFYRYFPKVQHAKGQNTQGLAQTGEDYLTFPFYCFADPVIGQFQDTLLG